MRSDCTVVAEEIRRGRVGAGLSLRTVAQSAGIDHATLWRFERGLVTELTLEEIGAVGATVGLDIRLRAFPAGDPIRDAAQQDSSSGFVPWSTPPSPGRPRSRSPATAVGAPGTP
jgi:transcriptional regulator with XRE-family HTH domain